MGSEKKDEVVAERHSGGGGKGPLLVGFRVKEIRCTWDDPAVPLGPSLIPPFPEHPTQHPPYPKTSINMDE